MGRGLRRSRAFRRKGSSCAATSTSGSRSTPTGQTPTYYAIQPLSSVAIRNDRYKIVRNSTQLNDAAYTACVPSTTDEFYAIDEAVPSPRIDRAELDLKRLPSLTPEQQANYDALSAQLNKVLGFAARLPRRRQPRRRGERARRGGLERLLGVRAGPVRAGTTSTSTASPTRRTRPSSRAAWAPSAGPRAPAARARRPAAAGCVSTASGRLPAPGRHRRGARLSQRRSGSG